MAEFRKNRHISDLTENKGIFIILLSFGYGTQIKFLKLDKITFKLSLYQNETHKSISSSSSKLNKGSSSTFSVSFIPNNLFICPQIISINFVEQHEALEQQSSK